MADTDTKPKATDLEAFRTAPMKEADQSFANWYLEGSGAQFNKSQMDAFMEGIKAAARLGAEFARTPERKAEKAALRAAAEKARAAKASEPKPAKEAKAKPAPKAKAKPAGADDLI
jgi:hypothetical protein